jgi:adenylate kinase
MKPYRAKRFFLSSLNTYLGTTLVETLRNDHVQPDNPHLIIGSLAPEQSKYGVPAGVRKVVDTSKLSFLSKVLLDSDVIVYDLFTCDLNEAEFAIKSNRLL